jgi:ParB family chromosome partitioning protein
MTRFVPDLPLADLKGADYNPRRIEEESLAALAHSLERLGVCKPIIVSANLIVAGHQRTRTLRSMGYETAPAIVLSDKVAVEDEIRFNQLHNGTDFDSGDESATVGPGGKPFCYDETPADQINGNLRARMANVRLEICKLTQRYGNWGACVATVSGRVLHAAQYVLACKALNLPARVYRVPDAMADEARGLLGRQYGVFSYDHLARKTYIQTFAQMRRLRGDGLSKHASHLYDELVLPKLQPGDRVLDFGCGQGDYVKHLSRAGIDIHGIEFFYRSGMMVDGKAVHRMIDAAAASIEKHGLFDVVVCDSVLNSVDSRQAEADVLACCNALCREGGRIYFSGRSAEHLEYQERDTKATRTRVRRVEFLDEHGFTALYRNGNWFYQKFHTEQQAQKLGLIYVGPGARYVLKSSGTSWSVHGTKVLDLPDDQAAAAIGREFDLIWPGGRTVGRAQRMLAAWKKARSVPPRSASSGRS